MKAVLISIHPRHCENIASGKKTVEVRKTAPKLKTPFRCYIYETKDRRFENIAVCWNDGTPDFIHATGKILGEFVCDRIGTIRDEGNGFVAGGSSAVRVAICGANAYSSGLPYGERIKVVPRQRLRLRLAHFRA